MEAVTVALPERKLWEILPLVDILETQQRMGRKYLERLMGKLHPMHLAVPGLVSHLYHIQHALTQVGGVQVLDFAGLSSRNYGLAGPSGAKVSLYHAPGRDCTSQTHPYWVLQRFGSGCRGHVALPL